MKLLIVDDEIQVRKSMKDGIDWSELGVDEVDDADGFNAWDIFMAGRHEIILMDIRMPGMNGIELSEKILATAPVTKIMILSGYSEFKYAQSAIKLGVMNYELKPVNARKVMDFVQRAISALELEQKRDAQYRQYVKLRKFKLLNELLKGELENEERVQLEEYLGFSLSDAVRCIRTELWDRPYPSKEYFEQVAERVLSSCKYAVLEWTENTFLIIYQTGLTAKGLSEYLKALQNIIQKDTKGSLYIDVSCVGTGRELKDLHEQCLTLESCHMYSTHETILYGDKQIDCPGNIKIQFKYQKEFCDSIEEKNYLSIERLVDEAFVIIAEERLYSRAAVLKLCDELISLSEKVVQEMGVEVHCSLEKVKFKNIKDYQGYLLGYFKSLIEELYKLKGVRHDGVMSRVLDFLKCNYEKQITVEQLAKMAGKTPNYFSLLFKNTVGQPFHKYLTNLRMEQAKKLILESDLRVYEIAEKVGFQDYKYFAKVFYGMEGCSISEYKRRKLKTPFE